MSNELQHSNEQERSLDPRVESLAIPLARDYAEKNYPKIGEDENGESTFESAWRGANGEKDLRGKSPEDVAADLATDGWTPEAAAAHAETMVVDIANTSYDQYSEHWKEQNRGGARYLVSLLDERGPDALRGLDLSDPEVRQEYGSLIHDNWIERNEWVKDPSHGKPDLAKPFAELSAEEQQKDIDQLGVLQNWLNDQLLEKYGYSAEEQKEVAKQLELFNEAHARLVEQDPEEYDAQRQFDRDEKKIAAMKAEEHAINLVEDETGETFNARRVFGYSGIVNGDRESYISGRFDRVEVAEVPVENPELVVEDERNTAWGRRLSKVKGWLRGVDRTASLESSDLRK